MGTIVAVLLGISGGSVLVAILLLLFLHPSEADKWRSIIWNLLAKIPTIFRSAKKQYIRFDLQGRLNSFSRRAAHEAPFVSTTRVAIEYVAPDLSREAFLADGRVVLRLREEDHDERNFMFGAYFYVSTVLLHKVKRYISKSQREAIDLFVTMKLLQEEKPHVMGLFLDEFLHPKTGSADSKIVRYFNSFEKMDAGGYFYPVFLQELHFLGEKVFGGRRDDLIIIEVNSLIDFLENLSARIIGSEESELEFLREYCRCGIVIVGRSFNITPEGEVWSRFIQKKLLPQNLESLYLVGPETYESVINNVAEALGEHYNIYRSKKSTVTLATQDGTSRKVAQYLVILRLKGARVFHPNEVKT